MSELDPVTTVTETIIEEMAHMAGDGLAPAPRLAHINKLSVDVARRRIYLGEISENESTWVAQALHYMKGPQPIEVWLNTPGGSITEMFALHDLFRSNPSPIHAVGYGWVASAGVLLLACATRRFVMESCVVMSHENRGGGGDDLRLSEAKDRRKWEDWNHRHWCALMGRYTPGKDADWWNRTTERKAEYWLLGGDAIVEAGLADVVLK